MAGISALGLEVFLNDMRYINPRFTYLLTYSLVRVVGSTADCLTFRYTSGPVVHVSPSDRHRTAYGDRVTLKMQNWEMEGQKRIKPGKCSAENAGPKLRY